MSYSNEYKVFWYLPKRTATRSIRPILDYFNFIDSDNHNFFTEEFQLSYYFISNVRNPYSRVVSIFKWSTEMNLTSSPFEIWVEKMFEIKPNNDSIFIPDENRLLKIFNHFNKLPNYVVRYEHLEEDLKNISFIKENWCDDLNKLFSENITNNRYNSLGNLSWQVFYNKDLAESVYSYFEHDFLYFNYDKNSWKNGTS